ncbi:spore maturation protein [Anaeromyxobacter oryzae]|uniref:Spore maturation protein n=1 Tax=Anaeromyxobacter oryzae TaxID=2918170 RepID=A0ABN6MVU9_9BACT|nr:nucleoside recognition domain-containing protein [Anaeromyxobacter oryzae]BDG03929.1 spore maturation protein [Anaeromyxobacter oryzae]
MLRAVLDAISVVAVPALLAGVPLLALLRRVKVYPAFLDGAKQGFETAVRILPPLVAIFVALAMLRASGALDAAASGLAPVLDPLGIPASVLPMVLVRPLSGGGALGVVGDVLRTEGPDGYAGRLVSVMAGSTETTFYVLAVYMGAVGITRYRQALPAALLADLAGFTAAVIVVRMMF